MRRSDNASTWNSSNRAWIGHRRSKINPIWLELATPTLGLKSFLTSDALTCYHGPRRRPSGLPQGILHFASLSFSLLIFGFCCGVWTVLFWERERERESSLSFWIDSLSLSLYNYSIYLPLFFFFTLFIGVSLCWSVGVAVLVSLSFSVLWFLNLFDWLLLCESCLLSGG